MPVHTLEQKGAEKFVDYLLKVLFSTHTAYLLSVKQPESMRDRPLVTLIANLTNILIEHSIF